jgi:hypothetical protein
MIDISLNIKQAYIWIRKAKKISEISQQAQRWIRSFLKNLLGFLAGSKMYMQPQEIRPGFLAD